jgi:hypothetical protein
MPNFSNPGNSNFSPPKILSDKRKMGTSIRVYKPMKPSIKIKSNSSLYLLAKKYRNIAKRE